LDVPAILADVQDARPWPPQTSRARPTLNARRIFTRDGGRWGIGQVHRILTRRTYIGEHEFNKRTKAKELKPVSEVVVGSPAQSYYYGPDQIGDRIGAARVRQHQQRTRLAGRQRISTPRSAPAALVGSAQLSSGRFAMVDDGLGFSLVPWRPALEQHIGRHISGIAMPSGGVDWSFGRKLGLGL
jgi:hypothetical protein